MNEYERVEEYIQYNVHGVGMSSQKVKPKLNVSRKNDSFHDLGACSGGFQHEPEKECGNGNDSNCPQISGQT